MANKFQPLVDSMESGLKDILGQLIDGTIQDLDGPIREIAMNMSTAARRRRMDLVEECRDQLMLIAVEKKLRLEAQADGYLETFLTMGVNMLINGAIGALASA